MLVGVPHELCRSRPPPATRARACETKMQSRRLSIEHFCPLNCLATRVRASLSSVGEPFCGSARTRRAGARDRHPPVGGPFADRRMALHVNPIVPEGFRCHRLALIAGRCGIRSNELHVPGEARRPDTARLHDAAWLDRHIDRAGARLGGIAIELDRTDRTDCVPPGMQGSSFARRHLRARAAFERRIHRDALERA